MKTILTGFICLFIYSQINAQNDSTTTTDAAYRAADTIPMLSFSSQEIPVKNQPVYKLKPIVDFPLFAVNTAWTLYAFTKIYSKPPTDAEVVLNLNKNDINSFDRWAVRPYSPHLDKLAYIPFNASMPLPLLFLIPQKTRKDFFKLTFLYLEAMSITGLLYTGSTYLVDRFRPYVYSSGTSMEQRMN